MHPQQVKHRAVIHYTRFERSLRRVATQYGVSKSTLSRWVKQSLGDALPGRRHRTSLHSVISNTVAAAISEQPFQTAQDLISKVMNSVGKRVSQSTMYRTLKKLRISYKRSARSRDHEPVPHNHPFMRTDSYEGDVIAVDESSFYWNDVPSMGWGPKGKRVKKARPSHRTRVSLLLAVGREGVIGYKILTGGVKSQHFAEFIRTLPNNRPLILDNCSIHKTRDVRTLCDSKGIDLRYIPPYCPWYNPVEFCFSEIKRLYRPMRLVLPSTDFVDDVRTCVNRLRYHATYFAHAKHRCDLDKVIPAPV